MSLTYGYVKFTSDTNVNDIAYELVCVELMNKWFEEFRTISAMFGEMEPERHCGFIVVNYLSKSLHHAFNVLNRHLVLGDDLILKSIKTQSAFLRLVCKLADRATIIKIIRVSGLKIQMKTWKALVGQQVDVKNCFSEEMRLETFRKARVAQTIEQSKSFLDFYGLPWFDNDDNKHDIFVHNDSRHYYSMCDMYFTQHRVFDERTETFYKIIILGDLAVLYYPEGCRYCDINSESSELSYSSEHYSDYSTGSYSSGSSYSSDSISECDESYDYLDFVRDDMEHILDATSSEDDEYIPISRQRPTEIISLKSMRRLGSECIGGCTYHNFIIDTVDVHIAGEIINMKLVVTTRNSSWQ